ncbi:MAG: hypothetical protein EKK37_08080 [Sphingobacteriales bacterium]|nr:MAG: hypothetical protein EKK37_08080 [Sphingobacteriales bacterium]
MKLLLYIIFISFCINCYSQNQPSAKTITAEEYLKKSHQQKTWAWILMGAGTIVLGTGVVIGVIDKGGLFFIKHHRPATKGDGYTAVGLTIITGSIPLFIAAARNKGKAMSLNIDKQPVFIPSGSRVYQKNLPAVSLKISL